MLHPAASFPKSIDGDDQHCCRANENENRPGSDHPRIELRLTIAPGGCCNIRCDSHKKAIPKPIPIRQQAAPVTTIVQSMDGFMLSMFQPSEANPAATATLFRVCN